MLLIVRNWQNSRINETLYHTVKRNKYVFISSVTFTDKPNISHNLHVQNSEYFIISSFFGLLFFFSVKGQGHFYCLECIQTLFRTNLLFWWLFCSLFHWGWLSCFVFVRVTSLDSGLFSCWIFVTERESDAGRAIMTVLYSY